MSFLIDIKIILTNSLMMYKEYGNATSETDEIRMSLERKDETSAVFFQYTQV